MALGTGKAARPRIVMESLADPKVIKRPFVSITLSL
jgi:hypothetical protein